MKRLVHKILIILLPFLWISDVCGGYSVGYSYDNTSFSLRHTLFWSRENLQVNINQLVSRRPSLMGSGFVGRERGVGSLGFSHRGFGVSLDVDNNLEAGSGIRKFVFGPFYERTLWGVLHTNSSVALRGNLRVKFADNGFEPACVVGEEISSVKPFFAFERITLEGRYDFSPKTPESFLVAHIIATHSAFAFWDISLDMKGEARRVGYFNELPSGYEVDRREEWSGNISSVNKIRLPLSCMLACSLSVDLNEKRYSSSDADSTRLVALEGNSNYYRMVRFGTGLSRCFLDFLDLKAGYGTRSISEDYTDNTRDVNKECGAVYGGAVMHFPNDTLLFEASLSLERTDDNLDSSRSLSRDIQSQILKASYHRLVLPFLVSGVDYIVRKTHSIYLLTLSGESNWNKSYLLVPSVELSIRDCLKFYASAPIRANHIIYDYGERDVESRNRIFRRRSYELWTEYTRGNFLYHLELSNIYEDYGGLIWQGQWVEALSWEKRGWNLRIELRGNFPLFRPTVGCSWHCEDEWEWGTGREKKEERTKRAIFSNIELKGGRNWSIFASGEYQLERFAISGRTLNPGFFQLKYTITF